MSKINLKESKEFLDFVLASDFSLLTDEEVKDCYDNLLNDCHDSYKIGRLEFTASSILKSDEIAYNQCLLDYIDNENLISLNDYFYFQDKSNIGFYDYYINQSDLDNLEADFLELGVNNE